jgi:hypothetical protein
MQMLLGMLDGTSLLGFVGGIIAKMVLGWIENRRREAQIKQSGRDEVATAVTKKTEEVKDAMDKVPRPTEDEVEKSLADHTF